MPDRLRRAGLLTATLLLLGSGFLPCLEVMGESASLAHLAWSGYSAPWCWVILGGVLPAALACFIRSPRAAGLLALLAALPALAALAGAWLGFGPLVWSVLRSGAYGTLAGAVLSLVVGLWSLAHRRPA